MSDLSKAAEAKSDQLNAIDLIGGPITVTITEVKVNLNSDQTVSVSFGGDNKRPWKPSKTMIRILITKWGDDETKFAGRHLTLFRNPTTTWGGNAVGGVEVSHMSDMDNDDRFLLSTGRGKTSQFKIEHLKIKTPEEKAAEKLNFASAWVSQSKLEISELGSIPLVKKWEDDNAEKIKSLGKYKELSSELYECINSYLITEPDTTPEELDTSDFPEPTNQKEENK
jgi:hypothetical protein